MLIKRSDHGEEELYVHIAFEFKPEPVTTTTFLGLDRGGARIGAGTVVDCTAAVVASGLVLEGATFSDEQRQFERRIAEAQRKNRRAPRLFRLRRRRANIVVGEYANRLIAAALEHKSQIVLEDIKGKTMRAFLTRSQFQKLSAALEYKAERVGLPKPIAVPAAYTSQTCARCGHRDAANRPHKDAQGKPIQDVFLCKACEYAANADDNASEIIALRALHQVQNGGRYQKFSDFQQWLSEIRSREAGMAKAVGR